MEKSQSYKYAIPTEAKAMWKSVSTHIFGESRVGIPSSLLQVIQWEQRAADVVVFKM